MSSNPPYCASKALFNVEGFLPILLDTSAEAEDCSICLKPLAHALPTPTSTKPHPEGENCSNNKKPLDAAQPGLQIKACGHVFGSACIQEWLQECNTCPMCRRVLFPAQKDRSAVDEMVEQLLEEVMEEKEAILRVELYELRDGIGRSKKASSGLGASPLAPES